MCLGVESSAWCGEQRPVHVRGLCKGWECRGARLCTAHAAGMSTIAAQPVAARLAAPLGRNPHKKKPGARPGDRRPDAVLTHSQQFLPTHSLFVQPAAYPPRTGRSLVRLPGRGRHPAARPKPQALEAARARSHGLDAASPGQAARAENPCAPHALGRADPPAASGRGADASAHPHPRCPTGPLSTRQACRQSRRQRLLAVHGARSGGGGGRGGGGGGGGATGGGRGRGRTAPPPPPPRGARALLRLLLSGAAHAVPAPGARRQARQHLAARGARRAQKSTPPPACAFSFSYVSKYW